MNQNQRDLRRAAMADFLQSLADLDSTFAEPLEDDVLPPPEASDSASVPAPPPDAHGTLDDIALELERYIQQRTSDSD